MRRRHSKHQLFTKLICDCVLCIYVAKFVSNCVLSSVDRNFVESDEDSSLVFKVIVSLRSVIIYRTHE